MREIPSDRSPPSESLQIEVNYLIDDLHAASYKLNMVTKTSSMKVFRVAVGLSQSRLADATGTYQGRISRLERGTSAPDPDEVERISQALGVPPDKLFSEFVYK